MRVLQQVRLLVLYSISNIYDDCVLTGGSDYVPGPYNVTIPAGHTSVSFDVLIIDGNILEDNENFSLVIIPESLPKLLSHGNPGVATIIILNDDSKRSLHCYKV